MRRGMRSDLVKDGKREEAMEQKEERDALVLGVTLCLRRTLVTPCTLGNE
jgi:hypothetical protein